MEHLKGQLNTNFNKMEGKQYDLFNVRHTRTI